MGQPRRKDSRQQRNPLPDRLSLEARDSLRRDATGGARGTVPRRRRQRGAPLPRPESPIPEGSDHLEASPHPHLRHTRQLELAGEHLGKKTATFQNRWANLSPPISSPKENTTTPKRACINGLPEQRASTATSAWPWAPTWPRPRPRSRSRRFAKKASSSHWACTDTLISRLAH